MIDEKTLTYKINLNDLPETVSPSNEHCLDFGFIVVTRLWAIGAIITVAYAISFTIMNAINSGIIR